MALMRAPRLLLFLQPEDCSLKQLSFWLIQNRWHVHVGLLDCTYVRVGECVSDRVGEKESLVRDGEALREKGV